MTGGERPACRETGSVLVVALWVMALLASLIVALGATARTELRLARNATDLAGARHACEAGVHGGLASLLDPTRNPGLPVAGTSSQLEFAGAKLIVSVTDEGGKVDLNEAPADLIAGLFAVVGVAAERARSLADAVLDWRDPDDLTRPMGAEAIDYRRAGRTHAPRDGPLQAVEELRQVLGVDEATYRRVAPLVTVVSGVAGIDPWAAPEMVLRAVPGLDAVQVAAFLRRRAAGPDGEAPLLKDPNGMLIGSAGLAFTVGAVAETETGAVARCEATVWLTGRADEPYIILAWRGA